MVRILSTPIRLLETVRSHAVDSAAALGQRAGVRQWLSPCFLVPVILAVGSLAVLVALGSNGWPGELGVAGLEYCEASRPGIVKQPANTFSNLGFVGVGLLIGWAAARDPARHQAAWRGNRLRAPDF